MSETEASYSICAFYKFVAIEDPAALKAVLLGLNGRLALKGTVIVAGEGINGTVSGTGSSIDALVVELRSDERFADLDVKLSRSVKDPFRRFKVKVKAEIVTFGHQLSDARDAGHYVRPEEWNSLISDPGVVVIDTRNDYEIGLGTFPGAIDPKTPTFRDFANFADDALEPMRDRKVAMFCTGGIRCEKATAYLRSKGFAEVYHLQGGILRYLEVVPPDESLWQGECFIFDGRVALEHGVKPGGARLCWDCGFPIARTADGSAGVCAHCEPA